MNNDVWDRIAARRGASAENETVTYGIDMPTEAELRLCGEVKGKRVLDIGCGAGEDSIAFAKQGAHVIAIDRSLAQLSLARKQADAADVRVEWHDSDAADLAFLRADSIDLAFAAGVLGEIEDVDRVFRQVHRVLRPGASFVFSFDHPMALAVGRANATPGGLPLGSLEVLRSYFDKQPVEVFREDERIAVFPRTIADVFTALHRAGYRVDGFFEPEPVRAADPGPDVPNGVVVRARKEGV